LDKATEKLLEGGEKAGAGALAGGLGSAATGATAAGLLLGSLTGAGAGLALGILVHTGKSYFRMRTEEQQSAYRYLTLLERAGVVFRSDLGNGAPEKERLGGGS
jgi:hypothetical protein